MSDDSKLNDKISCCVLQTKASDELKAAMAYVLQCLGNMNVRVEKVSCEMPPGEPPRFLMDIPLREDLFGEPLIKMTFYEDYGKCWARCGPATYQISARYRETLDIYMNWLEPHVNKEKAE